MELSILFFWLKIVEQKDIVVEDNSYWYNKHTEVDKLEFREVSSLKKKKNEINIRSSAAEYLTYVASIGNQEDSIEMRYEDENIWLTQKMMAILYGVDVRTINDHIKKCLRIQNQKNQQLSEIFGQFKLKELEKFKEIQNIITCK